MNLASIAALTGKPDEAFPLLRQAVEAAPADMAAIIPNEEELASLRKDPRFADLVAFAKEQAESVSSKSTR